MTKQSYPCEGFTNVFIQRDPAHVNPRMQFVVHDKVLPLVEELCKNRPQWTLKSANVSLRDPAIVSAHHFDVYENGQLLGEISVESGYRTDTGPVTYYRYDNPRLTLKRQRGMWNKTSKLDLAVKNILKAFHAKTLAETIVEVEQQVEVKLSENTRTANADFDSGFRRMGAFITGYIMANWDTIAPELKARGAPVPDDLPERLTSKKEAEATERAYLDKQGFTILTRGSDYIMVRGRGDERETEVKSSEQLTDNIRRNLGFLKLSEGSRIIPNVGVRLNESTFFVIDKELV